MFVMAGLIISRYIDEALVIETPAGRIRVSVADVLLLNGRKRAKLRIEAPRSWQVWREELICDKANADMLD